MGKRTYKVTEDEFLYIKKVIDSGVFPSYSEVAKVVNRSVPTILYTDRAKDFADYKRIQQEAYKKSQNFEDKASAEVEEVDEVVKDAQPEHSSVEIFEIVVLRRLNELEEKLEEQRQDIKTFQSVLNEINDKLDLVAVPKKRFGR